MLPVFWRNYKSGLKEEDLFDVLDGHKSSTIGDKLETFWIAAHNRRTKYALHLSLLKLLHWDLIITGIFQCFKEIGMLIVMPYAVGQLVSYFGNGSKTLTEGDAYMFASLIILCLLIDRIIVHTMFMWLKHMSMKIRVACCSLIYRKSLRLSLNALGQTNIGQIVNLMSNDVSKFDYGLIVTHYLWIAPLQVVVASFLLYRIVGNCAFIGIAFTLAFVPSQIYASKKNSVVRYKTALRTDERVRLMNEILVGIQIIKMYTWEKPFAKLISTARRFEVNWIRIHYYLASFVFALEMFVTRTSICITILVYLALGNSINADLAYSITAIYSVIRPTVTTLFSYAVSGLGECNISLLRIEQFLSIEEIQSGSCNEYLKCPEANSIIANEVKEIPTIPMVCFKNASVKWSLESHTNSLTDLNFTVDHNQLLAVIGPVGSGKSTLLNVILKELPITSGNMEIRGTISYSSQEAWLFLGSVRQNILFGDDYDEIRYKSVVKVCALESDFKMLPYGDRTIVREKGKSLSGGQRARINLARCVYKKADIYLLDDPLSAVDTKVGRKLYDYCIQEFLKDKICILITHQLQYLENADKILILNNGTTAGYGTYNELQNSGSIFAELLNEIKSNDETQDAETIKAKDSENMESNNNYDDDQTSGESTKESIATGSLGLAIYRDYFRMGGNYFIIFCVFLVLVLAHATAIGGDYFLSHWLNTEHHLSMRENDNSTMKNNAATAIYAGIICSTMIMAFAHTTVFLLFLVRAATNLHDTIFEKVMYATMDFFNKNPSGRILNRFSKDMGTIDEYIPYLSIIFFAFIASTIVTCNVSPWFLLPCIILATLLYLIRRVYIETSRQVRRIDGITRSPIYNHTAASMNGLTTIRAFNSQKTLINEYDNVQDNHSSAWYLYISSGEAFGLWIDITCTSFLAVVIYSLLLMNNGYNGGDVGLIITLYIVLAGMLQWGLFQWSELENSMTSVERLLEYGKQEMEAKRPPVSNLPRNWPEYGKVVFDDVSMWYEKSGSAVLKNVNFVINSGEKIGIVGRTGAGKTSTIAALFQFYPLTGSILIDGVDTTSIPLETLRSKISIIPQECVLFSGTMRKNLDPFEEYDDAILWNALEQVELKSIIEEAPGGLNAPISESGSNFSIGQRQLICLARAIIRNNKIIVMDEATANIDSHTDSLIQKTIRRNFSNCTIITIAHRLHTIMDSDRIIVMDKGKVIEYDSPYILLQNDAGIFQSMVQTTGATAKNLKNIAEKSYKLKNNL